MKTGDLVKVVRGEQKMFFPEMIGVMLYRTCASYRPGRVPLALVYIKGSQRYFEYSSLEIVSECR